MAVNYDLNNTGQEVQERLDQVMPNKNDIEQEALDRQSGDNALQGQIDAINTEIGESGQGGETINGRLDFLNSVTGNKEYAPEDFSGLGRVNLGMNLVEIDGAIKNVLTQAMMPVAETEGEEDPGRNTIYVIQYDYDLNGQTIKIPGGCVLEFDGGKIHKGTVNLNNCYLSGNPKIYCECKGNYKNEYLNPRWFGSVGDFDKTKSFPLSSIYSTLAEAQMSYPFAVSLNDELDYCGIQTALNLMKSVASGLLYIPQGRYKINQELLCKVGGPRLIGETKGQVGFKEHGTILQWTGSAGTIDEPKYILKMYTTKNDGTYDSDTTYKYRHRPIVSQIGFHGKSGAIETVSGWVLDYVSGVFIGPSSMYDIQDCNFNGLYDGIVFSTSLLCDVDRCWWYNIYRDCLRVVRNKVEGSTTLRILRSEFGVFGRYAIFINGQVPEDNFIVQQCDFEGTGSGKISSSNFFQGIRAAICFNGNNGTVFTQNRTEALGGHQYIVHFSNCGTTWIHDNIFSLEGSSTYTNRSVFIFTTASYSRATQEYTDYYDEYRIDDITDTRNLPISTSSSFPGDFHYYSNRVYSGAIFTILGNDWSTLLGTIPSSVEQISRAASSVWYHWALNVDGTIDYNTPLAVPDNPNLFIKYKDSIQKSGFGIYKENSQFNNNNFPCVHFGVHNIYIGSKSATGAVDADGPYRFFFNTYPFGSPSIAKDIPLFFEGKQNLEAGVLTSRKLRYNVGLPTSGTWNAGDIVFDNGYYQISQNQRHIGHLCIASGTPGTWISFGRPEAEGLMSGTFALRPNELPDNILGRGFKFFDTDNRRPLFWDGKNWIGINGFTATSKPHGGSTAQRPAAMLFATQASILPTNGKAICVGYTIKNTTDSKYYIATAIDSSFNITWTEESTLHPGIPSDAKRSGYAPPSSLSFEPYVGYFYINTLGGWYAVKSYTRSGSGTEEEPYVYNVVWKSMFASDVLRSVDVGFMYYDTSIGKPIFAKSINITTGVITWVDENGILADTPTSGYFADKPTVAGNSIPVGFKYFCTDKQTAEGSTNGIEIFHKGNNIWVDALGRQVV